MNLKAQQQKPDRYSLEPDRSDSGTQYTAREGGTNEQYSL